MLKQISCFIEIAFVYVLAVLNAIKIFEISSGIKAFTDYRSEGVVLSKVKWRLDLPKALSLVRTNSTNGAIHKEGQKNNKQERKGLSVSHGEEIRQ